MARKEYELTDEQLESILNLNASKPVPYMVFGGREPRSPQENANARRAALGTEMGFDFLTVQPVQGKGQKFFTAEESG